MQNMNASSLIELSFYAVLNTIVKCDETKRFEWRKYWLMISELPATLKARLIQSLGRRQLLSDENIGYLINNELIELNLYNCLKSDFTINLITKHCFRLKTIDLGARIPNYNMISPTALTPMFHVCNHLEELKLNNCIEVNDTVVESIAQNCQQIKVIQLSGCLSITDKAMKLIADNCQHLKSLDVSRTMVGDDGLCYFASGVCSKHIYELLVNNCSFVTNTSIQQLVKCCTSMKIFSFNGTRATMESFYEVITRPLQIQFDIPI